MSPLDYLSRYVSVSTARRQLYNKVFARGRFKHPLTVVKWLTVKGGFEFNCTLQGLPDFSWYSKPKRVKIYQTTTKYTKWS
jgi:hypothetical protein